MNWRYNIIKDKKSNDYYLAEVFFEGKKVKGWKEIIDTRSDSPKQLLRDLELMYKDAKKYKVLKL